MSQLQGVNRVTEAQLQSLLGNRESELLDFKREPYRITGASDDDKAALVKDVLAFANTRRDASAHILLGVRESSSGHHEAVGIPEEDLFNDATLQQIVNSKVNRPVPMGYCRVRYAGRVVGVIEIRPTQQRPHYLVRKFGGLLPNVVFVRHGSSNAEATPDEVAAMRLAAMPLPDLEVGFAFPDGGQWIGQQALMKVGRLEWPAPGTPDRRAIDDRLRLERIASTNSLFPPGDTRAEFEKIRKRLARQRIGFAVRNRGSVPANDVRVRFRMPRTAAISIVDDIPVPFPHQGDIPSISPISVMHFGAESSVSLFCPKVQAGEICLVRRGVVLDASVAGTYPISVQIFADELPAPVRCDLSLVIACEPRFFRFNP